MAAAVGFLSNACFCHVPFDKRDGSPLKSNWHGIGVCTSDFPAPSQPVNAGTISADRRSDLQGAASVGAWSISGRQAIIEAVATTDLTQSESCTG
ncbi:hypothetical protein DSCA_46250 [Desulfosarcina alkanivorans]|uniref:Uncharacterized protein n=1 Tax=Desulfosarcina alkanivorans TaxID=571177 RepID=A0A5K7YQU4_9BACT|nr:hypothetical protein DSCA_46250 [Desulfosarcina alkanivorans]